MMPRNRSNNWRGYLFVAPATLYLVAFAALPMLVAGWMSLHRWHLLKPDHPFTGWQNYRHLLADPFFRNAIWNTLIYVAFSVPLGVAVSLLVAVLVTRSLRGVAWFRVLYYLPAVCSQVALSMVWIWILLPEVGLINFGLRLIGLDGTTDFLAAPGWALAALVAMGVWVGLGPRMIIFVTGIQAIPEPLYEAAALDGCSAWQRFRYITLPLLASTMLFVTVTTTIASFQLFTPVYVMTHGGPRRATDVVLYHVFREAWQKFEVGTASAMSYVLFAMILLVAAVQFLLMRRGLVASEDAA